MHEGRDGKRRHGQPGPQARAGQIGALGQPGERDGQARSSAEWCRFQAATVLISNSPTRPRKISVDAVAQPVWIVIQTMKPSGIRLTSDDESARATTVTPEIAAARARRQRRAIASAQGGGGPARQMWWRSKSAAFTRRNNIAAAAGGDCRMRMSTGQSGMTIPNRSIRIQIAELCHHSRPASVIRSVTFLLLSLDGSTFGACRSASGTSFGFEASPLPTAYSKEVPSRRMACPPLPVIHFRNVWASSCAGWRRARRRRRC